MYVFLFFKFFLPSWRAERASSPHAPSPSPPSIELAWLSCCSPERAFCGAFALFRRHLNKKRKHMHTSSYLQHLFHVCPWFLIKLEYKNSKSCVDRVVGLWSLTFRPQSACYHGGSVSQAFIGQRFISLLECPVLKIFSIYSEDKLLPAFLVINTVTMTGSSREKSYYLLF